ncbi:MAG: DUF881 domain-containing protein [Actinomycetia bacterium]|nr:DUF881 domain-containing protein [Actinomycetes bacterium]
MAQRTGEPTPRTEEDPAPSRSGWRWRISRELTIWTIMVPLVAIMAGALFSASSGAAQGTHLRSAAGGLAEVIQDETRRGEIRAAEVSRLQGEVDAITERQRDASGDIARLSAEMEVSSRGTGAAPVTGPGVVVSLSDSPLRGEQIPPGLTVDDLVVHQQDVQAVVNALWRGGAEAMMIQDQRVIATSAVRCVGNTLILQGRVYSPPFVITAIGNVDHLKDALNNDRQVQIFQEFVAAAGLGYSVETRDVIEAPGFAGSMRLDYAAPLSSDR